MNPKPAVFPLVLLVASACEVGPKSVETQPQEPVVEKLYAPPPPEEEREPEPVAAEAEPPEQENLKAALLGLGNEEPEPPKARPVKRVRRRRAAPASRMVVEEEVDDGPPALSDGAFQSAITDWSGMKRCLASSAGRLGASSGALRVKFTIRGDGQVTKSRVVETSNDVARTIAPCVEQKARRIRFPAFAKKADEVEKTAKFVF